MKVRRGAYAIPTYEAFPLTRVNIRQELPTLNRSNSVDADSILTAPLVCRFLAVLVAPFVEVRAADISIVNLREYFYIRSLGDFFWRLGPDLLALGWALLLSPFLEFRSNVIARLLIRWCVVETVFIMYTLMALLQPVTSRSNISRFFFESPIMNVLGYCSYSICKYHEYSIKLRVPNLNICRSATTSNLKLLRACAKG